MADTFELFPPGACNSRLPLNPIRDQYTIVRLAPLEAIADGRPVGPAVVPRDVVYPELIRDIRRNFPEFPYDAFAKGGPPLIDKWKGVIDPPPNLVERPPVTTVTVGDVHDFIANPRVEIEGAEVTVDLAPGGIEDLLNDGTTLLEVGRGSDAKLVRVNARRVGTVEPHDLEERAVPIGDLYEFFSNPRVDLETRAARVHLTGRNVEELATVGVSRVDVATGDGHEAVYVRALRAPSGPRATPAFGEPVVAGAERLMRPEMTYESHAMMVEPPGAPPLGHPHTSAPSLPMGIHHHVAGRGLVTRAKPGSIAELKANPDLVETVVSQTVLPRFELVLYLPYRQTWELLGYSRGELLNSISLAPEEETTIEVFTWDRFKRLREDTTTFEREGTLDVAFTDKLSMETVKELSTSADWGFNIHGDVSVPIKAVTIGVSGAYDTKNSIKELHRGTQQAVSEAVRKASSRIKATRQTKVTESEEMGREMKVARKIKNQNKCHTLDLDYFEVLATYKVTTVPNMADAKLCVLTPMPITDPIDRNFLLAYEGELTSMMLSATYLPGFNAARMLAAWEKVCDIRCKEPCPCDRTAAAAPSSPAVATTPSAPSTPATTPVADPTKPARDALAQAARNLRAKVRVIQDATIDSPSHAKGGGHSPSASLCDLANDIFGAHPESEWSAAKEQYRIWLYRKVAMEALAPRFWAAVERFAASGAETPEAADEVVKAADVQVADVLNVAVLGLTYKLKALEIVGTIIKGMCQPLPFLTNVGFDDAGFDAAFKQLADALKAYKQAQVTASTPAATAPASSQPVDQKKEEAAAVAKEAEPPEYDVKELAEAKVAEQALLAHVRHNESYYRQGIWARLDPSDRLVFLSLLGDLTRHVDNEVVAFVGKKAALPLRIALHPDAAKWFQENVVANPGFAEAPEAVQVTLPTKGVAVESRLGACDACEDFILQHRALDLKLKTAEVTAAEERSAQEVLETKRYQLRLAETPAMLDDPDPHDGNGAPTIRVVVAKGDES
jgi:hypothetical protein